MYILLLCTVVHNYNNSVTVKKSWNYKITIYNLKITISKTGTTVHRSEQTKIQTGKEIKLHPQKKFFHCNGLWDILKIKTHMYFMIL